MFKKPEGYIPASELSEEEKEKTAELERKTDEIYRLRSELARFYKSYRRYIQKGKGIEQIRAALTEGQVLGDFIDNKKIEAELQRKEIPDAKREVFKKIIRAGAVAALELALNTYGELEKKGGVFKKSSATEEEKEIKAYYAMRLGEAAKAARYLGEAQVNTALIDVQLDALRSDQRLVAELLDEAADAVAELNKKYAQNFEEVRWIIMKNPEFYLMERARELREAKRVFDERGTIVETAYVKSKIDHMRDLARAGRPIFIHGELGSGKTELAKHFSRRELSKPHLERWEAANPPPDRSDKKDYEEWSSRRAAEAEALLVSGHKGLEAEQLIAARAVVRKETPLAEEQVRQIEEGWQSYRDRRLQVAEQNGLDLKTEAERLKEERKLYEAAYLEAFRAPLETREVLAPILLAAEAGRPVIIDEMNAVPHHVLIILNDFILRKPGDMITPPVPGAKSFKVKEGFQVLATGNYKPEDGKMYVGRQKIDAAFLSRWGLVSYDYLPMSRALEAPGMAPEELRKIRAENELFHMLATRLLKDDLALRAPEGALEQIHRLAVVARNLQDVFSGREVSDAYYAEKGGARVKPQDILQENVLSIRHLTPIIEQWRRDGYVRSLDEYLYLNYITRSDARPNEKSYIYEVLRVQGDFFSDEKGWPALDQKDSILSFPIEDKMYGRKGEVAGMRKPIPDAGIRVGYFSPKDVIERLFGPAPERAALTREFYERKKKVEIEQPEDEMDALGFIRTLRGVSDSFKNIRGEDTEFI